jgi:hypothetical protein
MPQPKGLQELGAARPSGTAAGDFFSVDDVMLHRTVFPRAHSIALVLSDYHQGNGEPSVQLYGWNQGMIALRGFYLLGTNDRLAPIAINSEAGATADASNR